jgi:multidrug/hemolysin transport system permease protein
MLALLILTGLHFIIFRKMNANNAMGVFANMGLQIDEKWSYWWSDTLMLSTLIPIGSVTISITALGQIVIDKEKMAMNDFYVSPLNRNTLLLSYLLSSLAVGGMICGGFVLFSEVYFLAVYGISFGFVQMLAILGSVVISLILGNTFVLILASFVEREQALGAIGTILGTMLGFFCGAYVPLGVLGETTAAIFSALPFLPVTVITKQAFLMNISKTQLSMDIIGGKFAKFYGYDVYFGDTKMSVLALLGIVAAYIVVFCITLIFIFKRMKKHD